MMWIRHCNYLAYIC